MVKKSVFTFSDSWPWALIVTFVLGGATKAVLYGIQHGIDPTGFFVLGIVALAFLGITAFRYIARTMSITKWNEAFHTRLGTAVIPNEVIDVPYRQVDEVCDAAAFYWANWAVENTKLTGFIAKDRITAAFNGATISVSSKVIYAGTPSWSGRFLGLQDGKNISVVYDKKYVIDDSSFLQLVKHEVSHLCLEAVGIDPGSSGNKHHEIFSKTGYC